MCSRNLSRGIFLNKDLVQLALPRMYPAAKKWVSNVPIMLCYLQCLRLMLLHKICVVEWSVFDEWCLGGVSTDSGSGIASRSRVWLNQVIYCTVCTCTSGWAGCRRSCGAVYMSAALSPHSSVIQACIRHSVSGCFLPFTLHASSQGLSHKSDLSQTYTLASHCVIGLKVSNLLCSVWLVSRSFRPLHTVWLIQADPIYWFVYITSYVNVLYVLLLCYTWTLYCMWLNMV